MRLDISRSNPASVVQCLNNAIPAAAVTVEPADVLTLHGNYKDAASLALLREIQSGSIVLDRIAPDDLMKEFNDALEQAVFGTRNDQNEIELEGAGIPITQTKQDLFLDDLRLTGVHVPDDHSGWLEPQSTPEPDLGEFSDERIITPFDEV
jgi:hypothetical protein